MWWFHTRSVQACRHGLVTQDMGINAEHMAFSAGFYRGAGSNTELLLWGGVGGTVGQGVGDVLVQKQREGCWVRNAGGTTKILWFKPSGAAGSVPSRPASESLGRIPHYPASSSNGLCWVGAAGSCCHGQGCRGSSGWNLVGSGQSAHALEVLPVQPLSGPSQGESQNGLC